MKYKFFIIITIHYLTLQTKPTQSENVVLTAPILTDYGEWTTWGECEPGYFVVGADLHIDNIFNMLGANDELGLINVVLECKSFLDKEAESKFIFTDVEGVTASVLGIRDDGYRNSTVIVQKHQEKTREGIKADIAIQYPLPLKTQCDGYAVGFAINTAKKEVARDNKAAANLRLYCSNLRDNTPAYVEGYGLYDGEWSDVQMCGAEYAICGIQAQAEALTLAAVDHRGITSLRFKCCSVPNPASFCEPTDTWELVVECDNIESSSELPFSCAYTQNVGVGASSTKLKEHYEEYRLNEGLGYTLAEGELAGEAVTPFWLASGLSQNFRENLGQSSETNHDWGVTSERTWNVEKGVDGKVDVNANYKGMVYQVVGRCGYFTARTNSFRRVDASSKKI